METKKLHEIPIQSMYNYSHNKAQPWDIEGYIATKQYFDPQMQAKKKKQLNLKKSQKNLNYVTKRGHFLENELKKAKQTPSSLTYGQQKPWDYSKEIKKSQNIKINPKLNKNTYIDKIEKQHIKYKQPGVCSYSLENNKNKFKNSQTLPITNNRFYYHDDITYLSNTIPGIGQYNPYKVIQNFKISKRNNTQPKQWVKKHQIKNCEEMKRNRQKPSSTTYSPMDITFTTFDSKRVVSNQKQKWHRFSLDHRFEYNKKKKNKQIKPGPTTYKLNYKWFGKGQEKKQLPWYKKVWKITKGNLSVYNS